MLLGLIFWASLLLAAIGAHRAEVIWLACFKDRCAEIERRGFLGLSLSIWRTRLVGAWNRGFQVY